MNNEPTSYDLNKIAMDTLTSIGGFSMDDVLDYLYGNENPMNAEIEEARKHSSELNQAITQIEADIEGRSQGEGAVREAELNRSLIEKVLGDGTAKPADTQVAVQPKKASNIWVIGVGILLLGFIIWLIYSASRNQPDETGLPQASNTAREKLPVANEANAPAQGTNTPLKDSANVPQESNKPDANLPLEKPTVKPSNKRSETEPKKELITKHLPPYIEKVVSLFKELPAALTTRSGPEGHNVAVQLVTPNVGNLAFANLKPNFSYKSASEATAKLEKINPGSEQAVLEAIEVKQKPTSKNFEVASELQPNSYYRLTLTPPFDAASGSVPDESKYLFRTPSLDEIKLTDWADQNTKKYPKECAMVYFKTDRFADAAAAAEIGAKKGLFSTDAESAWLKVFREALIERLKRPNSL